MEPLVDVWAQAALTRTVGTLPALHPWRLGDAKGSRRLLQWAGRPVEVGAAGSPDAPDARPDLHGLPGPGSPVAVLSVTARDPDLDRTDAVRRGWDVVDPLDPVDVAGAAVGGLTALARTALRSASTPPPTRWAGALVRLPGTWLPDAVWLPRTVTGWDDPGTAWPTESVELHDRFTLHAADLPVMAALLTPAVMAIALDAVPYGSAVTIAGDSVHVWWPYVGDGLRQVGRVARTARAARRLAEAFPHFVLADHPDRSDEVESRLADRQAAAAAYRASRRPGASVDPVMERIYRQSRAAYDR